MTDGLFLTQAAIDLETPLRAAQKRVSDARQALIDAEAAEAEAFNAFRDALRTLIDEGKAYRDGG